MANLPGSTVYKRKNLAEAFTWPLFTMSMKPEVSIRVTCFVYYFEFELWY
jgi:hypothetical protein